jgi:hypothetical protein
VSPQEKGSFFKEEMEEEILSPEDPSSSPELILHLVMTQDNNMSLG